MKKLYILRPKKDLNPDPWDPWYDKAFGFVVCADSPAEARKMAQEVGGDEINKFGTYDAEVPAWTDPKLSICIELKPGKRSRIIMKDFSAA